MCLAYRKVWLYFFFFNHAFWPEPICCFKLLIRYMSLEREWIIKLLLELFSMSNLAVCGTPDLTDMRQWCENAKRSPCFSPQTHTTAMCVLLWLRLLYTAMRARQSYSECPRKWLKRVTSATCPDSKLHTCAHKNARGMSRSTDQHNHAHMPGDNSSQQTELELRI